MRLGSVGNKGKSNKGKGCPCPQSPLSDKSSEAHYA